MGLEEASDVGFNVGGEGTCALVVLVVALAGVLDDQAVLDAALHPGRHVVIDGGEAAGHAAGLRTAIERAVLGLRLLDGQVDGVDDHPILGHIGGEDAAQAIVAQRTVLAVAGGVALGFTSEEGIFLCHTFPIFSAKVVIKCETTKYFSRKYLEK